MNRAIVITVLMLSFVVLAAIAQGGPLPGDEAVARGLAGGGALSEVVSLVASVNVWTPIVLAIGAILWLTASRQAAALLVAADLSAELVSYVVKELVNRPRPTFGLVEEVTASFPSNSVVRVAVTAGVLALIVGCQWRGSQIAATVGVVVVAGLVGFARIASGEHWPSDVVAAYLLAGVWVLMLGQRSSSRRRSASGAPRGHPTAPHTAKSACADWRPRMGRVGFAMGAATSSHQATRTT